MIITWFIMLSKKNNNKKKAHRALAFTILSLSVVSLIITMSAPDYSSAQVSDSQNTTTTSGIPSAITEGMNTTSPTTTARGENQSTKAEVRTLIEQARIAVQNNDIQGALMNLNSSLDVLEGGGNGEQGNNMTATPNEVTDSTTTTEAGTIGSGGAGGAGTAGGIMTGGGT
jgi:hypothetical protein